jgi:hypothetical protein
MFFFILFFFVQKFTSGKNQPKKKKKKKKKKKTLLRSAWPSLVDLDLTSTRVSLATIAPAATSHKALNKISLGGTGVASDGIAALCRGIESCVSWGEKKNC